MPRQYRGGGQKVAIESAARVRCASDGSVQVHVPASEHAGLFWTAPNNDENTLIFAFDINAVLRARKQRTTFDERWLREFHLSTHDPAMAARSPYREIGHIPVGASARFPPRRVSPQVSLWFEQVHPEPGLEGSSVPSLYRECFDRVVDAMIPDGPVVLKLSSGLDSTFLAATLASSRLIEEPIHAFTHSPHPSAPIPHSGRLLYDEFPMVRRFVGHFPGRFVLHRVYPNSEQNPLDSAAAAALADGVPAAAPANMGWIHQVAQRSTELGAQSLFTGSMGNFTFSMAHRYAARYYMRRGKVLKAYRTGWLTPDLKRVAVQISRRDRRRRQDVINKGLGPYRRLMGVVSPDVQDSEVDRDYFLRRLDPGCRPVSATGAKGIQTLDPFASEVMRNLASAMTPFEWSKGPGPRGYARMLGAGRVPDAIRLSRKKGVQSADQWYLMHQLRDRYYGELDLIAQTPVLAGWIDIATLRDTLDSLPWGEPGIDYLEPAVAANRILSLGAFIRMADAKLSELNDGLRESKPRAQEQSSSPELNR